MWYPSITYVHCPRVFVYRSWSALTLITSALFLTEIVNELIGKMKMTTLWRVSLIVREGQPRTAEVTSAFFSYMTVRAGAIYMVLDNHAVIGGETTFANNNASLYGGKRMHIHQRYIHYCRTSSSHDLYFSHPSKHARIIARLPLVSNRKHLARGYKSPMSAH